MRWRVMPFLGAASLLSVVILMQHPSTVHAQGTVIWSADHEEVSDVDWYRPGGTGYSGGEFNNGCAGTSPAHGFGRDPSGTDPWPMSLLLTMAAPCGAQLQAGVRMFRFLEPQQHPDLYYKVWYYFAQSVTLTDPLNPWWIIMAWKSTAATPSRDDPFFSINIANRPTGQMFIYLYEYKPYDPSRATAHGQTAIDLPVAKWFYIEAYYKSRGDGTGQVTIWQGDEANRVLLWDLQGVQTRYPDAEGGTTQWAVTNYGNGITPLPAQFAIDDVEIRTP